MDHATQIRTIVSMLTRRDVSEISLDRWPTDYGLDSMSLLIFREDCERAFSIVIQDEDWGNFGVLEDILNYVKRRTITSDSLLQDERGLRSHPWHASDMVENLEIGMPLTGINHLSENALLKHLGDLRWRHITKLTGTASKKLVNSEGERLYPAFFYVHVQFPEQSSMATYGENDTVCLVDTVARYGSSLLDGVAYIIPADRDGDEPIRGMEDALAKNVAAVRLSNVFVMQFNGAEWLRKSRPREDLIASIPLTETPPDSYLLNKQAAELGYAAQPAKGFVSVKQTTLEYDISPDRDVNGVGLLYFANYPVFLDLAERNALKTAPYSLEDRLINRRSLISRKIAYLNNASWSDSLKIKSEIWISGPADGRSDSPGSPVRIFSNQIAYRNSDGRAICVSSAEKVLMGISADEIPWISDLQSHVFSDSL